MLDKTILLVDDTYTNIDILLGLLEDEYELIVALSGEKALEILENEEVDLILLDIMMPEMDGFEVCRRLKKDLNTQDIPIIFITASSDEDSIEMAYDIGGNDYITKPFRPKELMARISVQLELADKTHNLENIVHQQLEQLRNRDSLLIQQSKMADMGQMISTIAHQLKQPLSVLDISASNIDIKHSLNREIDIIEFTTKIHKQIKFMSNTIDLFRTFFSPNKIKEPLFLNELIDKTLEIISGNIIEIEIINDYSNLEEKISIYPNELIQALMNIIKNAKDQLNNTKTKVIKIQLYKEESYQVITIQDNGGGIAQGLEKKIFENYFTTKDETKGTGIGLYIVKQIIEDRHNGKISVENSSFEYKGIEYKGAKFFIKLPIL